ncbi:MAG: hypothetical protein ABIL22_04330 [candidate division WOR-3 bacterium]
MKTITRKYVLTLSFLLFLVCGGNNIRTSPEGSYALGSTSFALGTDGSFQVEHTASSGDNRYYIVNGTFTYTHDFTSEEDEKSHGKIDITVSSITLNGQSVDSLEITDFFDGQDIWFGAVLLGWWEWANLVTYGGKMQLKLNVPARGYRPEDPWSGCDWSISGDPVE